MSFARDGTLFQSFNTVSVSKLSYQDLFDFEGYLKAIKDVDSANKSFSKNTIELNKQIASSYKEVRAELEGYAGLLSKFSVNTKNASTELVKVGAESAKLGQRLKDQRDAMQALLNVQELTTRSTKELKDAAAEVKRQYESLSGASADVQAKKAALGAEYKRVTDAIKLQIAALKEGGKEVKVAANSYKAMQTELTTVGNALKSMANAFDPLTGKINANNAQAVALQKRYIELNTTLKNIDGGLGNFQRNVGNYASGFNGLGNSINQLTREFPAFTNSVQTGFLALSNNIPIFFDQLQQTNKELKALRAEGKAAPSLLQALGSSFFTFGTILSLGVTLLTVYGKEIGNFVGKLLKAKEQFVAAEESAKLFNKALQDTSAVDAVKTVDELTQIIDLAKNGFISKEGAVKKYNETIGKTTGLVNSLEEAEKALQKNAEAYIQFTFLKAAANLALEEASKKALEAEQTRLKKEKEFSQGGDALSLGFAGQGGAAAFKAAEKDVQNARKQRRELAAKESEKDADSFRAIAKKFNDKAAAISKEFKFNFFGDNKEDKKDKKDPLNEYEAALRERQRIIREQFQAATKLAEDARENDLISEVQLGEEKVRLAAIFAQRSIAEEVAKNKVGYKAKESLLLDFNNTVIDAEKNLSSILKKLSQEEIRVEQKRIEEREKQLTEDLKNARDSILENQNLTNEERVKLELDFQKRLDEIAVNSIERRAEIEFDAIKKAELEKQAAAIRARSARTQDFGASVLSPRAAAADEIRALENNLERRRTLGTLTVEAEIETAKKIIEIKKKLNLDITNEEQRLFQLQQEQQQEIVDAIKNTSQIFGTLFGQDFANLFDALIDGFQKIRNEGVLTFEDIAEVAGLAFGTITNLQKENIENQLTQLEAQKNEELRLNQGNQAAQDAINKKYAREQAALRRKQAKADRDNAVFQILINASSAAVRAFQASPLTFGLPWSAAAIAFGALQSALVLSRPLPQFAKGTEYAPEGLAVVGEKGQEMVIDPDGRLRIVGQEGAEITYLERGAKVKTADETKKLLQNMEFDDISREIALHSSLTDKMNQSKQIEALMMMAANSKMNESVITSAIKQGFEKITIQQSIIDEHGQRLRIKKGNTVNNYMNQFKIGK